MKIITLSTIFLMLYGFIDAQTNMNFNIVDSITVESLPYAQVYNLNTQRGTISNEQGECSLLVNINDTIRISYLLS